MENNENLLNLEDCRQIMENYLQDNNFNIGSYDIKSYERSTDTFLCDCFSLAIKINNTESTEKEVRFCCKRLPLNQDSFSSELFAYKVLFNKFKGFAGFNDNVTAKCYYTKGNNIIVLEDLFEQGFNRMEYSETLSLEQIKLTLKTLAQYHTGSFVYQEFKSKINNKKYHLTEEFPNFTKDLFSSEELNWFLEPENGLNVIINLLQPLKHFHASQFQEGIRQILNNDFLNYVPIGSFYNVLCHGDLSNKNLMFCYKNGIVTDCRFINFHRQRYCAPSYDVIYFIYLNTTTEQRKHSFRELLHYYYNCLKKNLNQESFDVEEILSYEDFEISVNRLLPQIKLKVMFTLLNDNKSLHCVDTRKKIRSNEETYYIKLFKNDENIKQKVKEISMELKDLIQWPRVTIEDCFQITENKLKTTKYDFLNYALNPLGKIKGFLGDHYQLKINISIQDQNQTLNFFVKCTPQSKTRFDFAIGCKAFVKESFMYKTLIPLMQELGIGAINECIAPYHLIRVNDKIILDDIEAKGYHSANPRKPFSFEELQIIVKKVAVYHACNIILEEKLSLKKNSTFRLDCFKNELEERYFPEKENPSSLGISVGIKTVPHQIDLFPDHEVDLPQELLKEKVKKAYNAVYNLVRPSKNYRNVICHADLWASNIMMKYENENPTDCIFVDFQNLRYCPPAHDLLCILYLTTNRKTRKQFMLNLIDCYYRKFAETLNKYHINADHIYTYDDFVKSCVYMTPQAVCQAAIYHHFHMVDPDIMKGYTDNEEAIHKIFFEDRKDFITEMCRRDYVFRERLEETVKDLREMCMKYF